MLLRQDICCLLGLGLGLLSACTTPPSVSESAVPLEPARSLDRFQPVPDFQYLPDPSSGPERAVLARLEQELSYLQSLLREAQAQRNPTARIPFRYDLLQRDLDTIRHGIRQHLQGPSTTPRVFEPLRGDYRG